MERDILNYKIVDAATSKGLEKVVRDAIRQGWQPLGGVSVLQFQPGALMLQAMVQYSESDYSDYTESWRRG